MFDFSSIKNLEGKNFRAVEARPRPAGAHPGDAENTPECRASPWADAAPSEGGATGAGDALLDWASEDDFIFVDRSARQALADAERRSAGLQFNF